MASDDIGSIRANLYEAGWRQWSLIDGKLALAEAPDINDYHKQILDENDNCFLAITLYDCAVINGSFDKEPWLSYVLVKRVDDVDNSFKFARDSRVLHLDLATFGSQVPCEITAASFGIIHRSALLSLKPVDNFFIEEDSSRFLLKWIQRRTAQSTFPDEFNIRISKKNRQLGKLFQRYDKENITGFYIRLTPRSDELTKTDPYKVAVLVAVEDSHARLFMKEKDQQLREDLKTFFKNIEMIELEVVVVMGEGTITLNMLRNYNLWSPEYHSFKAQPEGIQPINTSD